MGQEMNYLILKREVSGQWEILGFYFSRDRMIRSYHTLLKNHAEGDILCWERCDQEA